MKLIEMMNFTPQEIDGPIAGYYFNNNVFSTEFTILGILQKDVFRKPFMASVKRNSDGWLMWEIKGGGVNLAQTSNLLQIEPNIDDKQKLLEMDQPLQIESNLDDKQKLLEMDQPLQIEPISLSKITLTDFPFQGITNNDEFIKIIQDFFNYQYAVILFDISDLKLTNIRDKQLELTQKALRLITDKNLYNFTEKFLYLYTVSPVEKIGGKSKRKSRRRKSKRKSRRNKNKYNLLKS
jgi:hypothetical protein